MPLFLCLAVAACIAAPWPIEPTDIFVSGTEGYPWYRIPSMVRLPNGNIAVFTEGRKTDRDVGYNDIVYKISNDSGITWTPLRVLRSESNATHQVALHNPVPVVTGGKVLVVFNRNMRDVLTLQSTDGTGMEWETTPTDITSQLGNYSGVFTVGPPQGLVLPTGRIIVAASIQGGRVIYSDDGGEHWTVSGQANPSGAEAQVATAQNGSLLLNARGPQQGVRWQSVSQDNGITWSTPRVLDFGFGSSCEGSIISSSHLLLFSHPGRIGIGRASINRWNLTVWYSADSGATWTAFEKVEQGLNETALRGVHTAYSSLLALNETHVGLVYERGPMGSRVGAGEYATIRWKAVEIPKL